MDEAEREKLIAKRNELLARLDAIVNDYKQGLDPDSGERAIQLENAEVLEAIIKASEEELERIEQRISEED